MREKLAKHAGKLGVAALIVAIIYVSSVEHRLNELQRFCGTLIMKEFNESERMRNESALLYRDSLSPRNSTTSDDEVRTSAERLGARLAKPTCHLCKGLGFINDPCSCRRSGKPSGFTCTFCNGAGIIPRACSCRGR